MKYNKQQMVLCIYCYTIFFCVAMFFASAGLAAPSWEPVPLTSEAQYRAGIGGGEGFQYVHAIVYAPSKPDVVYMSTDTSGIWRSNDGGRNWLPAMHDFKPFGARALAVDPLNPNIVFAAGFLGANKESSKKYLDRVQGIFRSLDGSVSWSQEAVLPGGIYKQDSKGSLILFVPRKNDVGATSLVYAAVEEGMYYSEKLGRKGSWNGPLVFPGENQNPEILDLELVHNSLTDIDILVATTSGLFLSKNNRLSKIGSGLTSWPRSISTSKSSPGVVLAAAGKAGLFISFNGGASFSKASAPVLAYSDVAISQVDANIQYARADSSSHRPIFSHDGGRNWHVPKNTNKNKLIEHEGFWFSSPFATHPENSHEALHVSNGRARILRTVDGGVNWEYSGSGFMGGRMIGMIFGESVDPLLCLTDHGLWQIKENGVAVKLDLDSPLKRNSVSACSGDEDWYTVAVGTWSEKVVAYGVRSSPNRSDSEVKIRWSYLPEKYSGYKYSFTQKQPVSFRVADNMLLSGTPPVWRELLYKVFYAYGGSRPRLFAIQPAGKGSPQHVVKTDDFGKTWQRASADFPRNVGKVNFATISLAPGREDRVYLGTDFGVWTYDGNTWSHAADRHGFVPDGRGSIQVLHLAVDPKNADIVYAACHGRGYGRVKGIYRSTDGGRTWDDFSYNFPTEAVHSIQINPYNGDIYLGSSIGTYKMSAASQQ